MDSEESLVSIGQNRLLVQPHQTSKCVLCGGASEMERGRQGVPDFTLSALFILAAKITQHRNGSEADSPASQRSTGTLLTVRRPRLKGQLGLVCSEEPNKQA